jgi:hypothetical protein
MLFLLFGFGIDAGWYYDNTVESEPGLAHELTG